MELTPFGFSFDKGGVLTIDLTSPPPWLTGIRLILPGEVVDRTLGAEADLPPLLVRDLVAEFMKWLTVKERYELSSLHNYRIRLGQFATWLESHPDLSARKSETWSDYYTTLQGPHPKYPDRRRYSLFTLKGHHQILTHFSTWLVQRKYLSSPPMAEIKAPKMPKNQKPKAVGRDSIRKMYLKASTLRDRSLLLFFRDTACRAHEALQLTWGMLKLEERSVDVVGKGNKSRPLFFKVTTRQVLEKYRDSLEKTGPNDPVWPGEDGPLTYSGLYKVFKRLALAAGVDDDFGPHSWRHAFGRDATLAGCPTAGLQKIFGHENLTTTQVYTLFETRDTQKMHDLYSPVDDDLTHGEDMVK